MSTDTDALWTCPVTYSETRQDARRADGLGRQGAWIAWFGDVPRDHALRVGDVGANLELTCAGLTGPPGFVVTRDAYLRALDQIGGRGELRARVAAVDATDPSALTRAAKECQALVRSAGMPEAVRRAVLDAYGRLGPDGPTAVRVSATADLTAPTSSGGTNLTFTDTRGGLQLVDRIVQCWASWWSPPVVARRASHGLTVEPAPAVIVECMHDARVSGAGRICGPVDVRPSAQSWRPLQPGEPSPSSVL